MRRNFILFCFIFLTCIGLNYETSLYTYGTLKGSEYGTVCIATIISLGYIVPALYVLFHTAKLWNVKQLGLTIAFIGGLFISGWISGVMNTYLDYISKGLFNTNSFLLSFKDALIAPIVEEPLKLLAVFFAVYLVPIKNLKALLLLGISAGLGFQISEDFSYVQSDLSSGFVYTISGILGRTFSSISSHWIYTSLTTVGLGMMFSAVKNRRNYFYKGLTFFVLGFILHFIWNSPFTSFETEIPLTIPFISAVDVFSFYYLYRTIMTISMDFHETAQ